MKSTGGYRVSYPWPIRFSKWRVCDELPWAGATYCVRVTWITAMTRAQCWPQKRVCELTAETRRLRLRSSRGSGKFSPDTGDRWHVALIRALHGKKIEGTCVCVCSVEEIFGRRGPGKLGRFLRNITIDYILEIIESRNCAIISIFNERSSG